MSVSRIEILSLCRVTAMVQTFAKLNNRQSDAEMAVTDRQLQAVVTRISTEHRPEAIKLMTMYHFGTSLLDAYGRSNYVDMHAQLTMFDRVVRFYADHHGITLTERIHAANAIKFAAIDSNSK